MRQRTSPVLSSRSSAVVVTRSVHACHLPFFSFCAAYDVSTSLRACWVQARGWQGVQDGRGC